jgi:multidrug efflux system membrane fusion protein
MNFETAHAEPSQKVHAPHAPPRQVLPPTDDRRLRPQPPTPGKSYWWAWLIVLIVLLVGGYFLVKQIAASRAAAAGTTGGGAAGGKGGAAGRPVPVVAEAAHRGDMPIYLNGLGTFTPITTDSIHTRVDGEIVKVAYTEGQIVHHDPTFNDTKKGDLTHFDQDKSDLLVQIDPRPYQVQLEQAQGQLERDQALLANSQVDLARYQSLYTQKAATDQQLETQKALVQQYEGTIVIDNSAIHNAQLQLFYCTIRTPVTGRVGLRLVDEGNIVHATDTNPIAVITQLQPITVIFTLPEDDIPQVTEKSPGGTGLPVVAWDRDFKTQLGTGTLQAIDNQVDPGSGTIRLRALFTNEFNNLFPSQFVNARLLVDTLKNVVIVPTAAVQRSPASTFVYVIKPDETVEMRTVAAGPTEGTDTTIQSGLKPGEMVVTDGVDKLVSGSKVAARSAGGKGKGGGKGATTRPSTTMPSDDAMGASSPAGAPGHRHGAVGAGGAVSPTSMPGDGTVGIAPAESKSASTLPSQE